MRIRVLWIEDGALVHLAELVGPVYRRGDIDLTIAVNATEGLEYLLNHRYDVVIVDIRLPPGEANDWINLYQEGARGPDARLGIEVLKSALGDNSAKIFLPRRPAWLKPDNVAVFSVESKHEVEEDLQRLGVKVFHQKGVTSSQRILLDLTDEVINNLRLLDGRETSQ